MPTQRDTGRLLQPGALCPFQLSPRGTRCRRPVRGRGPAEPVPLLDGLARCAGLEVVAGDVRSAAVLARESGHDMDVIAGMAHGDPPACLDVAAWCDASLVHQLLSDVGPLLIRQGTISGGRPQRALPDRHGGPAAPHRLQRRTQHICQRTEMTLPISAPCWFQSGRVPVPGNDVRIGVLVSLAGSVQVPQQVPDIGAAGDLRDHGRRRPSSTMTASVRRTT